MNDRRSPVQRPLEFAPLDVLCESAEAAEVARLDAMLLELIAAGATVFPDIYTQDVIHESDRVAAARGGCFTNMVSGFRVVEHRLQSLKGDGRIEFRPGRGWRISACEPVAAA